MAKLTKVIVSDQEGQFVRPSSISHPNSTCISMLSNQTSNLQQRQRQHRRQNSTPNAFDAPKVPLLPATAIQRHGSHRRGLSLDQPIQQQEQRRKSQQDDRTVSTNQGLQQQQQQILREAQQQRLARPGQQHNTNYPATHGRQCTIQLQLPLNEPSPGTGLPNDALYEQHNIVNHSINGSGNRLGGAIQGTTQFSPFPSTTSAGCLDGFGLGQEADVKFQAVVGERLTPNGSTGSINNREGWSLHPDWHAQQRRPRTPPDQSSSSYFPMTPATTPSNKKAYPSVNCCTAQSSPVKGEEGETVKASHCRTARQGTSCTDFFDGWRLQGDNFAPPSPPNTAPLISSSTFDMARTIDASFNDSPALKIEFTSSDNGYSSSHYSPMSNALSPTMSSFQSSPELAHASLVGNPTRHMPDLSAHSQAYSLPFSQSAVNLGSFSFPIKEALPPRAMSISELNLDSSMDVSIEDTGVTIDEIASFIQGPDPYDGKWICLYLECNKKFGRKENIKSHVQTHLGDRQFRCNHCRKCFVRQHDLKRHSKIHSGVKPYPCRCGNSFARHDALTRHRQRGMCIGAFEGVIKKQVKRGRPKKTRPDRDERLDKAERTRRRAIQKSYASSSSGWSESSFPQSPPLELDNFSVRGSSPFDNLQALPPSSFGTSPNVFTYTPPMSPSYSTGNCVSPQHTQHCHTRTALSSSSSPKTTLMTSITEESEGFPSSSKSPGRTAGSRAGTPPELCLSSSSPPASKFFDFDASSEMDSNVSRSISDGTNRDTSTGLDLPDVSENVDDMFLDPFGADNSMTTLERDPSMLLLEKFADPFSNDDLFSDNFTHSSDGFFGSR
ncbi:MAG: hypothetical protein M1830_010828 [Pleopsidium flavum]|nr:MAG: hypothetical protein M1830_010828 [Pleopsidium flavum]